MKRILTLLLLLSFVSAVYVPRNTHAEAQINFSGLSDPALLLHIQDSVYANLVNELDSDSFFVENVSAIYISKEYLDELAYNSQSNIYFGYTLSELEAQFEGTKFIFTLGEDGKRQYKSSKHMTIPTTGSSETSRWARASFCCA